MARLIPQSLARLAPCALLLLSLAQLALDAHGAAPLMFGLRKRFTHVLDLSSSSSSSSRTDDGHRSTLTPFIPAGYLELGEYYISMSLGTPAQTFDAVIDTGSGLIHVPCGAPPNITPPIPAYNLTLSPTLYQLYCSSNETQPNATECGPICESGSATCSCSGADPNECLYNIGYGDGSSATGFLFNDEVYLNGDNQTKARLEMGCATNFTQGMFEARAPYFLGIDWQGGSLLSQLIDSGATDDTFSICLGDAGATGNWNDTNSTDPTAADGLLVLGTAPPLTSPVQYNVSTNAINYTAWNADPSSNPGFIIPGLNLEMSFLAVGTPDETSSDLGLSNLISPNTTNTTYPALLDSGTSLAQFPGALAQSLVQALLADFATVPNATVDSNVNASAGALSVTIAFPTAKSPRQLDELLPYLNFQFSPPSPITIYVPPSRYLVLSGGEPFTWTFSFSSGGDDSQVILGNEIIRHWYIQATKSTLQVDISIVDSCNNLTFLSNGTMSSPQAPSPKPDSGAGSRRALYADVGGPGDSVRTSHSDTQHQVRANLRRPHRHLRSKA